MKEKLLFFGHNDVQKIWQKKSEVFHQKNTMPTLKHGGGTMTF